MTLKRVVIGLGSAIVLAAATVWIVGSMLPEHHQASVIVELALPRSQVWQIVRDLESSAEWRAGITAVKVLPDRSTTTYVETGEFGELHYQIESELEPSQLVMRIIDNKDFGGTWTYELSETGQADVTLLEVTEDGVIYNPIFRFFAKFVFGYSSTLETYVRDIQTKVSSLGNESQNPEGPA